MIWDLYFFGGAFGYINLPSDNRLTVASYLDQMLPWLDLEAIIGINMFSNAERNIINQNFRLLGVAGEIEKGSRVMVFDPIFVTTRCDATCNQKGKDSCG